jgi:hypothetical protein
MIKCIKLRRYQKHTLQGFADFELTQVGLVLHDCTWHEKNGREWIAFPARSYEGDDGVTHWQPLIEFAAGARQAREQFQRQAIAVIHAVVAEQDDLGAVL